jgi:hypothetical protein
LAQWIFQFYCGLLQSAKIKNNQNLMDRAMDFNRGTWTCGDHALKLGELFEAFGFKYIVDISVGDEAHGACGIIDSSGDLYLFDPWMLASENGNFSNSAANECKWNGMKENDWEGEMIKKAIQVVFQQMVYTLKLLSRIWPW